MFLALLTILLTDVDHWECLSDDTYAQLLRFDVWWGMNRDGNERWMGRGSCRPPANSVGRVRKKPSPAERGKESQSLVAAAEYIWYPTRFPPFPCQSASQRSRHSSRRLPKEACPPTLVESVYDEFPSCHRINCDPL
jgi:hypothetical protein